MNKAGLLAFLFLFGSALAADGDYLVVGMAGANVQLVEQTGVVYVYSATTGALVRTVNDPEPSAGNQFGAAVSVSGNRLVASSLYYGSGDVGRAYDTGVAEVDAVEIAQGDGRAARLRRQVLPAIECPHQIRKAAGAQALPSITSSSFFRHAQGRVARFPAGFKLVIATARQIVLPLRLLDVPGCDITSPGTTAIRCAMLCRPCKQE